MLETIAAIENERLAGHEPRPFRGEEQDRLGNLLGCTEPLEGGIADRRVNIAIIIGRALELAEQAGVDQPEGDAIGANAVAPLFPRNTGDDRIVRGLGNDRKRILVWPAKQRA